MSASNRTLYSSRCARVISRAQRISKQEKLARFSQALILLIFDQLARTYEQPPARQTDFRPSLGMHTNTPVIKNSSRGFEAGQMTAFGQRRQRAVVIDFVANPLLHTGVDSSWMRDGQAICAATSALGAETPPSPVGSAKPVLES